MDAMEAVIDKLVGALLADEDNEFHVARARHVLLERLEELSADERARAPLQFALAKTPNALTETELLMLVRAEKNPSP